MKKLKLSQGKVALVDDEDYDYLNQFSWNILKWKGGLYARRGVIANNKVKTILLHREIMKTPDGLVVDHLDHDGLNCQKSNMRNCTYGQNSMNISNYGASSYHGVSFLVKDGRRYIKAAIKLNGKYKYLGLFKTEDAAAKAYDKMAKEHYGEFANLNFK